MPPSRRARMRPAGGTARRVEVCAPVVSAREQPCNSQSAPCGGRLDGASGFGHCNLYGGGPDLTNVMIRFNTFIGGSSFNLDIACTQAAGNGSGSCDAAPAALATRPNWNRRSTTAAARRSRTPPSTAGPRCASRSSCTRTRTASASRSPTMAPASRLPRRRAAGACNTCTTACSCSAVACRSTRKQGSAPSSPVPYQPGEAAAAPSRRDCCALSCRQPCWHAVRGGSASSARRT